MHFWDTEAQCGPCGLWWVMASELMGLGSRSELQSPTEWERLP